MRTSFTLSALAFVGFVSWASAQDEKPNPRIEAAFKRLDANGDGKLSKEEFAKQSPRLQDNPEMAERQFKRADANGDGSLSQEEFAKARAAGPGAGRPAAGADVEAAFKKADANKDGKLSGEEFKALATEKIARVKENPEVADRLFRRADANSDGSLSLEEVKSVRQLGGRPGAAGGANFRRVDGNSDGKVTKEEFQEFAQRNRRLKDKPDLIEQTFKRLDADGNGSLSQEEFQKFGARPGAAEPPKDDK